MTSPSPTPQARPRLLVLIIVLTALWAFVPLLFSTFWFALANKSSKVYGSIDWGSLLLGDFGIDVLWFLAAMIGVYLLFSWIVVLVAHSLADLLRANAETTKLVALVLWMAAVAWFYLYNIINFPQSEALSSSIRRWLAPAATWLFPALSLLLSLAALIALSHIIRSLAIWRRLGPKLAIQAAALCGLVAIAAVSGAHLASNGQNTRPNVIFIGIDSLRTDVLGKGFTPNIDKFVAESILFEDAITPLARTFPSWMSVFTGQYPVTSGARYNLIEPSRINPKSTLPWQFRDKGYSTMLAIDERRFANFDESYGFQKVVGPEAGVGDFLLGRMSDTPLTNLLTGTWLQRLLFPYSFTNRALVPTYRPGDFDRELDSQLRSIDAAKPLFLTAHFCLPHWPYLWALPARIQADSEPKKRKLEYLRAIVRADRQFQELIETLRNIGRLDNALVVLLSDHGESLGDIASTQPSGEVAEEFDALERLFSREDWGHGTNVAHPQQYRILLAMRGFGESVLGAGTRAQPVTTVDIAPTLTEWLSLGAPKSAFDGKSLLPLLRGQTLEGLESRPRFLESGFSVPAAQAVAPDIAEVMQQGLGSYTVNPRNARLEVNPTAHHNILATKQRSVIQNGWQMVAVQDSKSPQVRIGLQELDTGQWTVDLNDSFASRAPTPQMLSSLKTHFGTHIDR